MRLLLDAASTRGVRVDIETMAPGSSLPRHRAGRDQVFYVVEGSGRVAGPDDVPVPVAAGQAARWERGEEHTSWADTPMTVLIVQGVPVGN